MPFSNFISKFIPDQKDDSHLEKGFAAFLISILIMAIVFGIAVSVFVLTFAEQKILRNLTRTNQAYYAAEAGIEDALLRLVDEDLDWSSPYTLNVDGATTEVEISSIIGGSRTITSNGNKNERIRKIQVGYQVSTQQATFYYGAQIGNGGIEMVNKSKIEGNIFSNGSVIGITGAGIEITGTAWIAINGNKLENLNVGEDAYVHTCEDSTIGDTLTYVSGGSVVNCNAGEEIKERPNEIEPEPLPFSQELIDSWKQDALSGGVISGDYVLGGKNIDYLGPKKIEGSLLVKDKANLIVTGTIWVTGTTTIQNTSKVNLDSVSYGSLSGVIIVDGKVSIKDSATLEGSGSEGSYLMVLSTNPSLDVNSPAIHAGNSSESAILYASTGLIVVENKISLREVTAYKLRLQDCATITYEVGLEDVHFTTGPGGSWEVVSWKEIE